MSAVNLMGELRSVPGLSNRTPRSVLADLEASAFGPTHPYRDGFVSTVKFTGVSSWERHSGDEILWIVEGFGYLILRQDDGRNRPQALHPGHMVIVPANQWHHIESSGGIAMVTVSPQPSDHQATFGDSPRTNPPTETEMP